MNQPHHTLFRVARGRLAAVLVLLVLAASARGTEPANDPFDLLRRRWVAALTGDELSNAGSPAVRERVQAQDREVRRLWESMTKAPVDDLWPDLKTAANSAGLSATCTRLGVLSKSYASRGSVLYRDKGLHADLLTALRWFIAARYHPRAIAYGNWWDWQIGVPLALNPCLACLYDELPATALRDATDAIEAFTPVISATGANGAWRAQIVLQRAILVRDAAKMQAARSWMESTMLPYAVPPSDPAGERDGFREGFYQDGSFFAHNRYPYNGGYGLSALVSAVDLLSLVAGSPWDVAGPDGGNVEGWITDGFEPFLFRGRLFDNVRGREISRQRVPNSLPTLLAGADLLPAARRASLRSRIKGMLTRENMAGLAAPDTARLFALLADDETPSVSPAAMFRHYPLMARTVVRRENFAASVSMDSDAVYDYESLNHENLKGWHTGDGWLQILDADDAQYSDGYWPTVDWHRLPGTTTVRGSVKPSARVNGSPWAGGADLDGTHGVTGFELRPFSGQVYDPGAKAMVPATDGQTLTARKSWFMLGDEIFCVGSGIAATDAEPVETILENHRLAGENAPLLTADGCPLRSLTADPQTLTARWLHLDGNAPGSSFGCIFMAPTRVQALLEERTGSWKEINEVGDDTPIRRRFVTLWLDHGVKPLGAGYAFILLPGRNAVDVARSAAAPSVGLLAASGQVHAVIHRPLGIIAANFWEDTPVTLALDGARQIVVSRRACVLYRHRNGVTELAVSDPTRASREILTLTFNIPLGRVLDTLGPWATKTSAESTVVTLDFSQIKPDEHGHTFRLKLVD